MSEICNHPQAMNILAIAHDLSNQSDDLRKKRTTFEDYGSAYEDVRGELLALSEMLFRESEALKTLAQNLADKIEKE